MKAQYPKIKYDKSSKILSVKLNANKSIDSDIKGNIVIDYDKKGDIVNIDIMGVSLGEFVKKPALKEVIQTG